MLRVALELELGIEIVAPGLIEDALDQRERHGRRGGETRAQRVRLRHQLAVVERFPNQSPCFRLVGAKRLGGEGKRACAGGTNESRQQPRAAAIGNEPDLGEGLDEARRARRQNDVAGERDVGAGAGGDAVDRGNDRKRQGAQLAHERIVIAVERTSEDDGFAVLVQPLVQILPGAERAAGAGEQERAAVAVVLRLGERALEVRMHGLGECVELPRAVERDDAIAFVPLDQNRCFFHARLHHAGCRLGLRYASAARGGNRGRGGRVTSENAARLADAGILCAPA